MVVGTARVVLSLSANRSLKGKRKVVRRVLDRVRAKYNVAAAEVADMDEHRRAVLGFAVVSNDQGHANSMLDKILDFVASHPEAPVVDRQISFNPVGDLSVHGGLWDPESERWQ